jgi:hypothetical protein
MKGATPHCTNGRVRETGADWSHSTRSRRFVPVGIRTGVVSQQKEPASALFPVSRRLIRLVHILLHHTVVSVIAYYFYLYSPILNSYSRNVHETTTTTTKPQSIIHERRALVVERIRNNCDGLVADLGKAYHLRSRQDSQCNVLLLIFGASSNARSISPCGRDIVLAS